MLGELAGKKNHHTKLTKYFWIVEMQRADSHIMKAEEKGFFLSKLRDSSVLENK